MNNIKVWPHLTIMGILVALIPGLGTAFWLRHERSASAEELPYAARIQRVDGQVAFSDSLASRDANAEWTNASPNQPFSVGDRIYTRDNSRTSLAFSGRNFARLNPNTSLDVVSLGDRRTQLALRDGSAMFDLGYLAPNELFEVATPYGAVNFDEPGLYNVGFDNNGDVLVSVLSGLAQVVGSGGSGRISKGEMLTLLGQTASQFVLSRLNGQDAGSQLDDYYRYQYPNSYDGRYSNYDAYLNDPYYYDPYRTNPAYKYASSSIPGLNDLDYYGDWQNLAGYGNAWRPRVDEGWVPYQEGYWTNDYPYGPTWVSSETWGYAPYHYGRWASVGNQWYWIPDAVNTTPSYAPALVAFVPLNDANQVGWVPLGPGDSYAPRYYDENWQAHYLTRTNLAPGQLANVGIPGSITIAPVDDWGRAIDPRSVRRIDQQRLSAVRPTLDPLTLTPLRNAVIHSAWGRGKISLPPGIARKLEERRVMVGAEPNESRFGKHLAKSLRVERVSAADRNRKFKVRDDSDGRAGQVERHESRPAERRSQAESRRQPERERQPEMARQRNEAGRGNRGQREVQRQAVKEIRQPVQPQRNKPRAQERENRHEQRDQQKAERKAQPQRQGERVASPARPEFKGPPIREGKHDSQERKQGAPDHAGRQDQGGGGKGRGKGKP